MVSRGRACGSGAPAANALGKDSSCRSATHHTARNGCPRRTAILWFGGDKGGNDRWYEEYVPRAGKLYEDHLAALAKEGLIHDKKV